jgi:DNA polymerase III gamma/tau subunit
MSDNKAPAPEYRVLARKYRPRNFDELIGQDALVRTLKNAIDSGRVAHAFMLTGVRGVGKTTTARIIAKALNYKGPDGKSGPTTGSRMTARSAALSQRTATPTSSKWTPPRIQASRTCAKF